MKLAILMAILTFVVFMGGIVVGVLVYRHYIKKYYNAIASQVFLNIAEDRGYVTFLDNNFTLHCVDQRVFDSLLNNILEVAPEDREM